MESLGVDAKRWTPLAPEQRAPPAKGIGVTARFSRLTVDRVCSAKVPSAKSSKRRSLVRTTRRLTRATQCSRKVKWWRPLRRAYFNYVHII